MQTAHTRKDVQTWRTSLHGTIGFVPTMGALHAGHISLVRRAKHECDHVVVSIYVNPTQFNNPDDLSSYPRDVERDCALLRSENVDLLFLPHDDVMYGDHIVEQSYNIDSALLSTLCAPFRPGHFEGVCQVVEKLFNIIEPDVAYFGKKDYQQGIIVRQMCRDLSIPVRIMMCETVRDKAGLALSSRNQLLSDVDTKKATRLYAALKHGADCIQKGILFADVQRTLTEMLHDFEVQYLQIVDAETLQPADDSTKEIVLALAVFCGKVRLIDSVTISA